MVRQKHSVVPNIDRYFVYWSVRILRWCILESLPLLLLALMTILREKHWRGDPFLDTLEHFVGQ